MDDPYFFTLAGLTLAGVAFVMVSSLIETISTWRKIHHYTRQLPEGEYIPAETLGPILGLDPERLKDFTGRKVISRYEAENIIRDLVTKEWWQL